MTGWEYCSQKTSHSNSDDSNGNLEDSSNSGETEGNNDHDDGVCLHKEMFPMHTSEFYGSFLIVLLLAFTNTGGLGGGGIMIPVMIGIFRFDTRNAVTISNASTMVSSGARNFINLKVSHPLKRGTGTITDYSIALLMLPGIVIGASLGSIVNLSVPGPIICAGFILCNFYIASVGVRNYQKVRRAEAIAD